jgi:hypothetical protein
MMPTRPEIYRQKALECELAASAAVVPTLRQTLMDLAKQWRELAGHSEYLERVYGHDPQGDGS